jgi:hypothetical protein
MEKPMDTDTVDHPGIISRSVPDPARSRDSRPKASAREVCEYFHIVPRTLARWLADERLGFPPPLTINGRRYFDWSSIERFQDVQLALAQHGVGSARAVAREQAPEPVVESAPKAAAKQTEDKTIEDPRST